MSGDNVFETLQVNIKGNYAECLINRPEVHNALNDTVITELNKAFFLLGKIEQVRVVVLSGAGKSFCAGADLNWMRGVAGYSFEKNFDEAMALSNLLRTIKTHPKPIIARVNGAAGGGGLGILSACDFVIAVDTAKFAFSEVRLGLAPSVISPFVMARIGEVNTRELFITGERFDAQKALEIGLVGKVVTEDELDDAVTNQIEALLVSSPDSIAAIKELLFNVYFTDYEKIERFTASQISRLRASASGQEGMAAFLEKRKPKWIE